MNKKCKDQTERTSSDKGKKRGDPRTNRKRLTIDSQETYISCVLETAVRDNFYKVREETEVLSGKIYPFGRNRFNIRNVVVP